MSDYADPHGNVPARHLVQTLEPVRNLPIPVQEQVRTRLSAALEKWCANVIDGVQRNRRNAMNLWARSMGLFGADVEVSINLAVVKEFGIPLEQLRGIVNTHRGLSDMTLEQCERDGVELLKWVAGQDPARLPGILAALASSATELRITATNGVTE